MKSGNISKQWREWGWWRLCRRIFAEATFLWWGLCIPSFRTITSVINKQSGICVPSVRTTTYVHNRLNTSFCTKDHKTHQAISNLNQKFWKKSTLIFFTPLPYRDNQFHNHTFIWICIHILHLVYMTSFIDLCFNSLLPGFPFYSPWKHQKI